MKKRRKGGLIQKLKSSEADKANFRIIAIKKPSKIWLVGRYNSFKEAKNIIDAFAYRLNLSELRPIVPV